ncbi:LysR family transcriptional regulator [Cupriavidus gilardii]|uniref:LysR substrate-binding domain-containing protein n=1 Tax=Cupriavidus gilardii TaxID=82541 RepID=UPI0021D9B6B1
MRIPVPLNALRAFEAAARHLSIKDAALELAVTPSAVSHQLRTLEDLLGVELLRRVGGAVELTDAGRRLAPTLNAGFSHIAASVQALRDERLDGPLRLHTLPAIAINWLAPRLAAYPFGTAESALDITTVQGHADLAAGTADVGLWFGEPPWPGLVSETLFAGTLGVYARAGSLAATPEGRLAQLAQAHLFVSRYGLHWEQWLQTLPAGPQHPALITQVDSCGLALQAASEGAGLCLVVAQLAERSVRAGLLEPLFDHEVPAGGDFHLVYPPALGEDRRLNALRTWLREHCPPEDDADDPKALTA